MRLPFVISVPHGSFQIPGDIRDGMALTEREILESTDLGAREVFTQLPVRVALWSRWSRLVVDLNRDFRQRDPKGVVPGVDYYGREIYNEEGRPEENEVERRLQAYYWPYHHRLKEAVENPEIKALFDCHSLVPIGPSGAPDPLRWRKDIVLGNNGNPRGEPDPPLGDITCPAEALQMMKKVFVNAGFSVSVNQPYSGGFITTHYGLELIKKGRMSVQIEINQDLYVDRESLQLDRNRLGEISNKLQQIFREIARKI
jgi:N-formylglutamate amidohydrolase